MSRETAKAFYDAKPGEVEEYVDASDAQAALDVVYDDVEQVVGDVTLLTHTADHADDLVHVVVALEGRIAALEAAGGGTEPVTAEGTLQVDMYSTSFVRVRDTAGILADGQDHWVDFALATVAGPGGEVIDPIAGVPAGTAGTWFDSNGNLGNVNGPTGTPVNQTTLRNWVKYGHNATASHYLVLCHTDLTGEHPLLIVTQIVNVT